MNGFSSSSLAWDVGTLELALEAFPTLLQEALAPSNLLLLAEDKVAKDDEQTDNYQGSFVVEGVEEASAGRIFVGRNVFYEQGLVHLLPRHPQAHKIAGTLAVESGLDFLDLESLLLNLQLILILASEVGWLVL